MSITYNYFLCNSEILPISDAVVSLSRVEYAYGFGVYETIRVSKGKILFMEEHCARLMESASIIGLEHDFKSEDIRDSLQSLIDKNQAESCNLKLMLIGGRTAADATLYGLCLNPLFPDRKLYKSGAHLITYRHERLFPHAKSLNMLPSYLAYRQARQHNAYDALLVNRQDCVTEGTRTNFFALKGKTIYSPPSDEILLGVTRDKILQVAQTAGFKVVEQPLPLKDLTDYEAVFISSTSTKIMPVISIDEIRWPAISASLKQLMAAFDDFLASL